MKIRIKGNSIRFRLTKTEVEKFDQQGFYKEQTFFGNSSLFYALEIKEGIDNLISDFQNNCLVIYIPKKMSDEWLRTDKVGFENTISFPDGSTLFLLVEKDWTCLDNTIEDQSDNFPNPRLIL